MDEELSQSRNPKIDGRQVVIEAFLRKGTPQESVDIIIASLSKATLDQYQVALNQWNLFCNREKLDFFNSKNHSVLKFLTKTFKEGASYGTLNSYRPTISLISTDKIIEDPLITRLLEGIFKLKPVFPKYSFTWDVSIALNYTAKLSPLEKLSFATLTLKTVMLLSLGTAQRAQTIAGIQ